MLVMFRVRNFASFKEETVLDLRAVSYKDMKNHVLKAGNNNIVKTLAIYGKNASGKSNLISALYYFESFILISFMMVVIKETMKKSWEGCLTSKGTRSAYLMSQIIVLSLKSFLSAMGKLISMDSLCLN